MTVLTVFTVENFIEVGAGAGDFFVFLFCFADTDRVVGLPPFLDVSSPFGPKNPFQILYPPFVTLVTLLAVVVELRNFETETFDVVGETLVSDPRLEK